MMTRLIAAAVSVAVLAAPVYASTPSLGRYQVDAERSSVSFRVRHMGLASVKGRFKSFSGAVDLTELFEGARVEGTVEVGSIDTGIRKRDDHLRSDAFFDAATFPEMLFRSSRVAGTPEAFEMEGELTIRGVTKPVRFKCRRAEGSPADGTVTVIAEAVINRRDFGITYNPVIAVTVAITLEIVAVRVR